MEKFKIRYSLNIKLVISMLILVLLQLWNLIFSHNGHWFHLLIIIVCTLVLSTAIIRRLLKPRTIQFENGILVIENVELEAKHIVKIFIDGSNTIGLRPSNKRIVPIPLCFKFVNNKEGLNTLIEWARINRIEIQRSTFIRWI